MGLFFQYIQGNISKEELRELTGILIVENTGGIEADEFVNTVEIVNSEGDKTNNLLDYIFSNIDNFIGEKKFNVIDKIFETIPLNEIPLVALVAILTITANHKHLLFKRNEFYDKVEPLVKLKYSKKEANELLYDLK